MNRLSLWAAALGAGAVMAAAVIGLAIILAGCELLSSGGSGTETSNGEVIGRVLYQDGSAASGADLFLRKGDYLQDTAGGPGAAPNARTDAKGYFQFQHVDPGEYQMEIRNGQGKALLSAFNLPYENHGLKMSLDTLRPVGKVEGKVEMPESSAAPAYIQVYGLERLVRSDLQGNFALADLPPGHYRLRAVSARPGSSYADPAVASITSGDTARIPTLKLATFDSEDYTVWPFTRTLYLNTAAAGVSGTVTDFPLLVRLDGVQFDFSLSDGKDIRFADPGGRHLHAQLEEWDPAGKSAAFWVKLDTVFGGRDNQSITLYWGKRDAPDFSDGKSVFASFGGVWHFAEDLDALGEGQFKDASPSQARGAAHLVPDERMGAVGRGGAFGGAHLVRAPGNDGLKPARGLTLSAWVNVTASGALGGEFASMGDNYGMRVSNNGRAYFYVYTDTTRKQNVRVPEPYWPLCMAQDGELRKTGWHHVAGRYDGANLKVYVDGTEKGSCPLTESLVYPFGQEFRMGTHGNEAYNVAGYELRGSLDEVQMSGQARSGDWIKLAFQNQRQGSVLVEFR